MDWMKEGKGTTDSLSEGQVRCADGNCDVVDQCDDDADSGGWYDATGST